MCFERSAVMQIRIHLICLVNTRICLLIICLVPMQGVLPFFTTRNKLPYNYGVVYLCVPSSNITRRLLHIFCHEVRLGLSKDAFQQCFPKIAQELIDHFTRNPSSQDLDKDLHKSARSYTSKTRYVQRKFFVRWLANEESVTRDWLVYSPSTGNVYCYVCKLFRSGSDSFSLNGVNDWKNAHRMTTHERSDSHLVAVNKGFERIVAVVTFLAERGQPFRGHTELFGQKYNGNYLGLLELLS